MGKNMWIKLVDDELEDFHPGCMGGFMHSFDYHHWHHNLKQKLLHRIHDGRRHNKGNGGPKAKLIVRDSDEVTQLLNDEAQGTKGSRLINKRSLRARLKALIADEASKERNGKQRGSAFHPQSKLQRTYSIHHLEPLDNGPGKICTNWKRPVIILPSSADNTTTGSLNAEKTKLVDKPDEEHADVLEIFKVNKELFLKILNDTDDDNREFYLNIQPSNAKARLIKSGSFPVANAMRRRNFKPSELKHKQSENFYFRKSEKIPPATRALKLVFPNFTKNLYGDSEFQGNEDRRGILGRSSTFHFQNDETELDTELTKVMDMPTKDSNQSEEPNVTRDNDIVETCGGNSARGYQETDMQDVGKTKLTHSNSSSLNWSLDRYAWLFESSFGKSVKLHPSRSLKLSSEYDRTSDAGHAQRTRRVRSLSHLDLGSFLQSAVTSDANLLNTSIENEDEKSSVVEANPKDVEKPASAGIPVSKKDDLTVEEIESSNATAGRSSISEGMEFLAGIEETEGTLEEVNDGTVSETNSCKKMEFEYFEVDNKLQESYSTSDTQTSLEESEGLECKHGKDSSVKSCQNLDSDSLSTNCTELILENFEHANKPSVCMRTNIADLEYVTNILDLSGIGNSGFLGKWDTFNEPLSYSVFKDAEACWHKEQTELSEENSDYCYHHQLLFDLVNEVLLRVCSESLTYYRKALSSSCHIRPFPVGNHIVSVVFSSISALLNMKEEQTRTLDGIVAYDLDNDSSWMNLQTESECVSLELEGIIFDELLEETLSE